MLLSSRIQEQMADQRELERCDQACDKTFHQSACLLKHVLCISYHAGTKTSIVKNIDVIAKVAYTHGSLTPKDREVALKARNSFIFLSI